MLNPPLDKQIAEAARRVEESRRAAHRDPSRLGELVEHIHALAELRQQEGDFRKAESLYREALYRIQDTRSPDPEMSIGVLSLLAYLYDRWGKSGEAAAFYRKALDLGRQCGIHDPERVATMKNNLALLHKGQREFDQARACYEEAIEEFRAAHGEQSAKLASVYNNLGVLLYQNLELESARDMHLQALRIREAAPPSEVEAGELSQSCINLGAVYKALGDFRNAHECMEKARSLAGESPRGGAPAPRMSAALILDQPA